MSTQLAEVELEYPMMINGQEVIVKRYSNPKIEAQVNDHRELSFYKRNRANNKRWSGQETAHYLRLK